MIRLHRNVTPTLTQTTWTLSSVTLTVDVFNSKVISVAYLSRVARKRGLCCRQVSVRLSVRPSRSCTQTAEDVSNFFSPILVFDPERRYPLRKGTPSSGASEYTGVGKICNFRLKSKFISQTVRDRTIAAMELQQEVIGCESIRVGSDDLE